MTFKKGFITFLIISIIGTLGHFLYEWTGESFIIGLIFPVNESTWEHLKLLFFPTLVYSAIELIKCDKKPNLIVATTRSLLLGMLMIVALFYTYSGVLGYRIDLLNILIFYIAVAITVFRRCRIYNKQKVVSKNSVLFSIITLAVFTLLFFIWSYIPPNINLFISP